MRESGDLYRPLQGLVASVVTTAVEETAVGSQSLQLLFQLKVSHSAQAVTHLTTSVHSRGLWSLYPIQA